MGAAQQTLPRATDDEAIDIVIETKGGATQYKYTLTDIKSAGKRVDKKFLRRLINDDIHVREFKIIECPPQFRRWIKEIQSEHEILSRFYGEAMR